MKIRTHRCGELTKAQVGQAGDLERMGAASPGSRHGVVH